MEIYILSQRKRESNVINVLLPVTHPTPNPAITGLMRNYHSREQSDKRRLHLHKDEEANDSKGHLSFSIESYKKCIHMQSVCRGRPDDLSDDSTFFLARVRAKRFSALKRKVIRLWKGGQSTSNGDCRHTTAVLWKYMQEICIDKKKKKKNITCYIDCMLPQSKFASAPSWESLPNKVIQSCQRVTAHTTLHMYPLPTQSGTCYA